jgi:hypothetical protein
VHTQGTGGVVNYVSQSIEVEDSPATTSSVTYKLQFARLNGGTFHVPDLGADYKNTISARTVD